MSPLTQSPRIRRLAVVLGVASLGSTAAYGVGTQVGDGVAGANQSSSSTRARGPSTADLQKLADKLGVSVTKLKAALDATRPAKPSSRPSADPFVTALAAELNVSADKLKAALDATRPSTPPAKGTRPDRSAFASALAGELGLDQATVKAALDKVQAAHRADETARRTAMAAALAKQLGLDQARVESALSSWHPAGGPRPGGPPPASR
jgi:protein-disulfide isomerase-like protein with CxxC motif